MAAQGGGMLDDEELALLRQIEQVIGVVVDNRHDAAGGMLVVDTDVAAYAKKGNAAGPRASAASTVRIAYDWAVWCHGYSFSNYEKLNRKRGAMTMGMLKGASGGGTKGHAVLFYPINWWGSACVSCALDPATS